MHVGVLIFGDINQQSGGYMYDRQLVSYLERRGDTVEVISLSRGSYMRDLLCSRVPEEITAHHLDILIQDELVYPRVFNLNRRIKERLNCPLVSLVHLLDSSRPQNPLRRLIARRAERQYLLSADGVILNSEYTLRKVNALLKDKTPPHIIAVPAASHQEPAAKQTAQQHPDARHSGLNILYAGNVIRQKGLHVLLEALGHMDTDQFRLTVAGRLDMEPGYVKSVRKSIKRKNLQHAVRLTGPLDPENLTSCYLENDVMVLPSVHEAYGIVYIEAQHFGLPVIGTIAGGAREIIQHGINGYLIEPGDSRSLADLLGLLLNDTKRLKDMRRNAQTYFRQHPSWDDSCARIREFLTDIIRRDNMS
ncbi:MAG: glycosyltransferase family 4 protein [Desulfuromonadaceae bacterium]